MKSIPLSEYLELPEGWKAERFPGSVMIINPNNKYAGGFHPADLENRELAKQNAREIYEKGCWL